MEITKDLNHFTNIKCVSLENLGLNIVDELSKLIKLQ